MDEFKSKYEGNDGVLRVLEQDYGLSIIEDIRSEQELLNDGYYKLDAASVASNPQIMNLVRNTIERKILGHEFSGMFRADVDVSRMVEASKGEYLGMVRGHRHIEKMVHWTPVKDEVSGVLEVLEIADVVFCALSVAVGEYFKVQINQKLTEILAGINEIRQFLENDKMSELEAGFEELQETYAHLKYIKADPNRISLCVERIRHVMHIARKDMLFFGRQIESIKNSAGARDKREVARENTGKIVMALSRYRLALALFCETKLIELYLSDVTDPDELDLFRQEMEDRVNSFIETYSGAKDWCRRYYLTHNLASESDKLPFIETIDAFLSDAKKEGDARFTGRTRERLNSLQADPDDLFIPVRSLERYAKVMRRGVELVYLNDDVYTNIPISNPI